MGGPRPAPPPSPVPRPAPPTPAQLTPGECPVRKVGCSRNSCCPGVAQTGMQTFPCPGSDPGWNGCQTDWNSDPAPRPAPPPVPQPAPTPDPTCADEDGNCRYYTSYCNLENVKAVCKKTC